MPIDIDRPLRDRLGEALHRMAEFDNPKGWVAAFEGDRHVLREASKEAWREQADRFAHQVAVECGIVIKNAD